jgi:hypothetical protein
VLGTVIANVLAAAFVLWMTLTLVVRLIRNATAPRGTSPAVAGLFEEPLYVPSAWVREAELARGSYDR